MAVYGPLMARGGRRGGVRREARRRAAQRLYGIFFVFFIISGCTGESESEGEGSWADSVGGLVWLQGLV